MTDKTISTTKPRKGNLGRPRKDPSARKTTNVGVRMTADEREIIEREAGILGISEYLRTLGLKKRVRAHRQIPELNAEKWKELGRLREELADIAKSMKDEDDNERLMSTIEKIEKEIVEIRSILIGGSV